MGIPGILVLQNLSLLQTAQVVEKRKNFHIPCMKSG